MASVPSVVFVVGGFYVVLAFAQTLPIAALAVLCALDIF